jgi:uracil-DNA glycosylase family 4
MADLHHPADPRALEGFMAFWADAGVECAYAAEPVDRIAEGARRLAPKPAAPAAPIVRAAPATHQAQLGPNVGEALVEARRAAAAATDLAALEAAVAAFEGCPLKGGATNTVFSRGRPDATVMVIGEGPGAEEDRQGQPFVGPSGRLLDRMLGAAGLGDQVFITNTVFWRAPANRTPSQQEQEVCLPFVERAIALVRPRALLLMGGASAKHMLKRPEGILSLRGRWQDWVSEDGSQSIPAMPTLHPAFLLRQPVAKGHAWQDILTLLSRLEAPA